MTDLDVYDAIEVTNDDGVLTCRLNRPASLNAVDHVMHHELEELFARIAEDRVSDGISVVVMTGAGRAFCAGGDLKVGAFIAPPERADDPQWHPGRALSTGSALLRNMLAITQPVIAAVNGDAVGLGATLALCCDIVLGSEVARLGDPHVLRGLVAGDGGAVIWPLMTSLNIAKEYLMTGDLMDAVSAERAGLFNHVYAPDQLMIEASRLARRLAELSPSAVRWTKQCVNKVVLERMNLVLDTSLALERINQIVRGRQTS